MLGAPLTTVQTNAVWQPLIGDPSGAPHLGAFGEVRFWLVNVVFLVVCVNGLVQDLRRRLPGFTWEETLKRAWRPFALLIVTNYVLSMFLWWVSAPRLATLETTLLWGTLSLYLGLFVGLFAQGSRLDNEDVADK